MKKKVCICLFCVIVCWGFCAHALQGRQGYTFTLDGIEYQVRGNKAHVISFVEEEDTVIFHETVNGYPVVYVPRRNLGSYAFRVKGRTLIIEEGIMDLPNSCFNYWDNLENLVLPSTLRSIGKGAFCYNLELVELTLPEGLEMIGENSFRHLEKLETVYIPSTLQVLGEETFDSCEEFQAYDVAERSPYYKDVDGVLYSKDGKTLVRYPAGREGSFEIPVGVEEIHPSAFEGNRKVTSITIPEGVTVLPSGLLCTCYALTEIYIPSSVTKIEEDSLPWYGSVSRVHVAEDNPVYVDIDGVLFERAHPEQILYFPWRWGASYDIPPGVIEIKWDTFAESTILTTITLPRSFTEVPDGAFFQCIALERVALPITLKRIGEEAFRDCIVLTNIILPCGLEEIGDYAFRNCPTLAEITLPDSIITIGEDVFDKNIGIYATKESTGYWYAREHGLLWAVPGGTPEKIFPFTREYPTAVVNNRKVDDTVLNLYTGPSETHMILGKYPNGTTVDVLGTEGDWAYVRLGDETTEGYMFSQDLSFMENYLRQEITTAWRGEYGHKDITGQPAYLYSYPMEDAPRELMEERASMEVSEVFGVWYKVIYEDKPGYVLCQYFSVTNAKEGLNDEGPIYAVVTNPSQRERLHLHKEPSVEAESLGQYVNGTHVRVLEFREGDWWKVQVDGKEGYMVKKFLTVIGRGELGE